MDEPGRRGKQPSATTEAATAVPSELGPASRTAVQSAGARAVERISTAGPNEAAKSKVARGALYVHGNAVDEDEVSPSDPEQGILGDCWFVAAMIAVARANPRVIKNLIHDNGDGTYVVSFYVRDGDGKPFRLPVTVDALMPVDSSGNPVYTRSTDFLSESNAPENRYEIWPAILEKALAKLLGTGKYDENEVSYATIAQFDVGPDGRYDSTMGYAMRYLTGGAPTNYDLRQTPLIEVLRSVDAGLKERRPIECATRLSSEYSPQDKALLERLHLFDQHAYAVLGIDLVAWTISLRDPHGATVALALGDFYKLFSDVTVGASLSSR